MSKWIFAIVLGRRFPPQDGYLLSLRQDFQSIVLPTLDLLHRAPTMALLGILQRLQRLFGDRALWLHP